MKYLSGVTVVAMMALVASCGGRQGGDTNGDSPSGGGDVDNIFCVNGSECRSGVCEGGYCAEASTCSDHGECATDQYCHFPSAPIPWVPGTGGACSGPCTDDASCGIIGQECHEFQGYKRCYTNIDCNPPNNSADCPPGEVCWDTHFCKWPPDECYFQSQCPDGWICDATGHCVDPNILTDCTTDQDCVGEPGCEGGCICFDGACQVQGSCQPTPAGDTECGAGNYCAGGVCQPATACPANPPNDPDGHNQCLPYGLVCRNGYCGNPEACGGVAPDYTCPVGWECKENYNPPSCFPEGSVDCTRDDMCLAGYYCNLGTSTCEPGCRSNADCGASCSVSSPPSWCNCPTPGVCNCNTVHQCVSEEVIDTGDPCTSNTECEAGTACAYTDAADYDRPIQCLIPNECPKSCRQVCDSLMASLGLDTCPTGEKCGTGSSDFIEELLRLFLNSILGGENASVCYPI